MNEEMKFFEWFNSLSKIDHSEFGSKVRELCYKINENGVNPSELVDVMKKVWKERMRK